MWFEYGFSGVFVRKQRRHLIFLLRQVRLA